MVGEVETIDEQITQQVRDLCARIIAAAELIKRPPTEPGREQAYDNLMEAAAELEEIAENEKENNR